MNKFLTFTIVGLLTIFPLLGMTAQQQSTAERTGQYMDDAGTTAAVKAALLAEPGLKSFDIHVVTNQGVVTLSGDVDSQASIDAAVNKTQRIEGVKSVDNRLNIE